MDEKLSARAIFPVTSFSINFISAQVSQTESLIETALLSTELYTDT